MSKPSTESKLVYTVRVLLILVIFCIQIGMMVLVYRFFSNYLFGFVGGNAVITLAMLSYLIYIPLDGNSKVSWMMLIVLSPIFGALMYWFVTQDFGHRVMQKRIKETIKKSRGILKDRLSTKKDTLEVYLQRKNDFFAYQDTKVTYYPLGEEKWDAMLEEMEKAKDFIFMEYFIIQEGKMWNAILEVLKKKVKEGVEVRVMYDGTCELTTLPRNYAKKLQSYGIKARAFSPIVPFVSTHYNYRDHRKILVIDGKVGFNGGVNLADEYINAIEKYGHWKDTAIRLEGNAVNTLTLMFLQMWCLNEETPEFEKYFRQNQNDEEKKEALKNGIVIPYGDNPLDEDRVGERVYIDILSRAEKYVHIMTPYLILDEELTMALKFAAEQGVDVSIMLPGVPDKKTPYALAKTHYKTLLESGVKIFEYSPGFLHAKSFVSDDKVAVVGTINLDYRSLYHHFECATYLKEVACIREIEQDYQDTLKKCRQITMEEVKQIPVTTKALGYVMKVLAPLM